MKAKPIAPPSHDELQQHALAALVLEVSATKAGNVHPQAAFDDCDWLDFVASAIVTAPLLAQAQQRGVGQTVLDSVVATQNVTMTNTNLGMLLLLAPLAAAPSLDDLPAVLEALTLDDARRVYRAIALAKPGGLGKAARGDVNQIDDEADILPLHEAMALAADRDSIARQYVNDFEDVLALADQVTELSRQMPLDDAIARAHLWQMARQADTLIARKAGPAVATQAQTRARKLLDSCGATPDMPRTQLQSFDRWLRADGRRRNPGSTADLVAAALFVALRRGTITLPSRWRENLWS